jgi:hypothetical protein
MPQLRKNEIPTPNRSLTEREASFYTDTRFGISEQALSE